MVTDADKVILKGRRVLIVEDEDLIATLLEDLLVKLECEVVSVATQLSEAVTMAKGKKFDVALLDIMLEGLDVHPVMEVLAKRDIPYAFVTGYGLPRKTGLYAKGPILNKPITLPGLKRVLREALVGKPG